MLAYDWPGNVRELENCLERTYAFTSGPLIHTTDLPREVANLPAQEASNGNGNGNGNGHGKIIPMAQLERQTILSAITELNGDKLQAARLLGIGKTTLYRKLKDYAAQEYQSSEPIPNLLMRRSSTTGSEAADDLDNRCVFSA